MEPQAKSPLKAKMRNLRKIVEHGVRALFSKAKKTDKNPNAASAEVDLEDQLKSQLRKMLGKLNISADDNALLKGCLTSYIESNDPHHPLLRPEAMDFTFGTSPENQPRRSKRLANVPPELNGMLDDMVGPVDDELLPEASDGEADSGAD